LAWPTPSTGEFQRAAKFIADYHQYTFNLQNPDGSFSTSFAAGRGSDPNPSTRLYSTGHTLEWMVFSAPEDLLASPRMAGAVEYLCGVLADTQQTWDLGALGHALHALAMYQERAGRLVPGGNVAAGMYQIGGLQ
jgi:hypothetical protein